MPPDALGWWVVSSESLMEMLERVAAGESPEMVYIEFYCNSDHELVEDDDAP